jgi:hypothetical protein
MSITALALAYHWTLWSRIPIVQVRLCHIIVSVNDYLSRIVAFIFLKTKQQQFMTLVKKTEGNRSRTFYLFFQCLSFVALTLSFFLTLLIFFYSCCFLIFIYILQSFHDLLFWFPLFSYLHNSTYVLYHFTKIMIILFSSFPPVFPLSCY